MLIDTNSSVELTSNVPNTFHTYLLIVLLPENLHTYFELSVQAWTLGAVVVRTLSQLLPGANKVVNALRLRIKAFICGAGSEKMDSVVKT